MIRFFVGLTVLGVLAGVCGAIVFAVSGADGYCPYGSFDKPSSSASVAQAAPLTVCRAARRGG